ncbi:integrase-like protein [Tamaricihabitans halophyticus]|uniref:Integrase-like protein n=1 Tax=Tamaricihabitans halophyticus TaxID=1262583 RepID=A0A4R2PXA9_9PSEU|nr:site-specific integrase [Tamaricihabitans halophyticus]TCP40667.1 integrase-like protein [Tamaricihabitans halophyticus]
MPRKERPEGTRRPNGASSIYLSKSDGKWHGWVTVGIKDNGELDRRHVQNKDESKVISDVRKLEQQRDTGKVKKPGRSWTVEKWLTHWFENIAAPSVRPKAASSYRTAVYRHLIPGLGAHRIDKIQPEHFEKLYAKMRDSGLSPGTAHQVHRTARTAFGEASRRAHIVRNPVELAKAPRTEEVEIEPFESDEIADLISAALSRRNGVRFIIALSLGTRQGETIGLKWSRLDKNRKALRITKQLQRGTWKHGCNDPHACGAKYHKTVPCKEDCKRHQREVCPPPCSSNCTSHARWCPERHGGGLVEVDVKSKAGRRGIVLPDQLYDLIIAHEDQQAKERELAGTEWHAGDWMFTQPNGNPLDPRRDLDDWKALLKEAGVREARLHDARHTAATVLLVLGVPERAVMEFMGWSNTSMAKRYQHITSALRRDIADRLNGYLWGS